MDRAAVARLDAAFRAVLPLDIAVASGRVSLPPDGGEVFASEAAAMVRAVVRRQAEFFAGRAAAHRAMRALNHPPEPVLMGEDRAPVWPEGLIGSISHCDDTCVALVAKSERYRALAVDIEPDEDLPGDVIDTICLPSEQAGLTKPDGGRMARLIFSAKEAIYKLQYPIAGKLLEFSDVEIVLDVDNQRFAAHVGVPLGPGFATQVFEGWFGRAEGQIFCVMFVT